MFLHFTITFSSFVKICIGYLTHWTHLVIISCIFLIIRVGISHTYRRLDIQHIGNLVPAEFVLVQRSPIIIYLKIRVKTFLLKSTLLSAHSEQTHMKWSILWEEPIQRAAARASVQPEHQRVFDWVPLRSYKPAGNQDTSYHKLKVTLSD